MKNVCVVGGGNIAHSLAAKISAVQPVSALLLPEERWNARLCYEQSGRYVECTHDVYSTADPMVVRDVDFVFVALPQFAFESALERISPFLHRGQIVVLLPAPAKMSEYAERIVKTGADAAAMQRVPYISRILNYGASVRISDDRKEHKLVVSNPGRREELAALLPSWFGGEVSFLSSFFVFGFNNSNPLLHPSRLVVLFRDWKKRKYAYNPPFYGEWTDESSELYIAADREMAQAMKLFPKINLNVDYEDVLTHYGVSDAKTLTEKIRSIPSFTTILSPMKEENGLWVPDFSSRYFTEDVAFGTRTIQYLASSVGVETPVIDELIASVGLICK